MHTLYTVSLSVGQVHRILRARIDQVVEPPHQILVHVMEANRIPRTALPPKLEIDRVV